MIICMGRIETKKIKSEEAMKLNELTIMTDITEINEFQKNKQQCKYRIRKNLIKEYKERQVRS